MNRIKQKISDITSVDISCRILFKLKKFINLFTVTVKDVNVEYADMLSAIQYFSSYFPINKKLTHKIEKNYKSSYNIITVKRDKQLIQKYFNENLNPKLIQKPKGLIRGYQTRILNLAKEVVVPNQSEIGFSLSAGSLIGALRHDGFIPWDDDIDFDILRDDCYKLQKIIKEKYIFVDSSECKSYEAWYHLLDKAIREHPNEVIWIYAKNFIQAYKGTSFADCAFCDFFVWEFIKPGVSFSDYEKWWQKFGKVYRNPKLSWGEIREIYYNELNTSKIFSTRDNCEYIACTSTQYTRKKPARFEKLSTFLPYKKHKFEDTEFCIANDYETYLTRDFKNWKNIPAKIQYAKHINLYGKICPSILSTNFYIDYDKVRAGKLP